MTAEIRLAAIVMCVRRFEGGRRSIGGEQEGRGKKMESNIFCSSATLRCCYACTLTRMRSLEASKKHRENAFYFWFALPPQRFPLSFRQRASGAGLDPAAFRQRADRSTSLVRISRCGSRSFPRLRSAPWHISSLEPRLRIQTIPPVSPSTSNEIPSKHRIVANGV